MVAAAVAGRAHDGGRVEPGEDSLHPGVVDRQRRGALGPHDQVDRHARRRQALHRQGRVVFEFRHRALRRLVQGIHRALNEQHRLVRFRGRWAREAVTGRGDEQDSQQGRRPPPALEQRRQRGRAPCDQEADQVYASEVRHLDERGGQERVAEGSPREPEDPKASQVLHHHPRERQGEQRVAAGQAT